MFHPLTKMFEGGKVMTWQYDYINTFPPKCKHGHRHWPDAPHPLICLECEFEDGKEPQLIVTEDFIDIVADRGSGDLVRLTFKQAERIGRELLAAVEKAKS